MHVPSLLEKKLNLKSMTLLIVDGNDFSRNFARNLCRSFHFAEILTAGDTNAALGHLQSSDIDMMLTDWMLKPERADAFVRQVRTSPGIRSPFLPIIVLSGIVDRDTIAEARDAGTNEFMARPFELGQLLHRFSQVLLSPRPFIRCPSYVGPDRRRQQRPFEGPDRRAGAAKPLRPTSAGAAAAKAASAGGLTIGAMVEAGEKVIVAEEQRYREVRRQDLEELGLLFEQLRQGTAPPEATVEQIYLKSHSLKAMGQTFGFPLLTEAGDSLCSLLWRLPQERMTAPMTLQGVEAHVRTMTMIVAQDIRHDGGALGAELIDGLRTIVSRIAAEKAGQD
jgi:CheY-like chemotaxis protein